MALFHQKRDYQLSFYFSTLFYLSLLQLIDKKFPEHLFFYPCQRFHSSIFLPSLLLFYLKLVFWIILFLWQYQKDQYAIFLLKIPLLFSLILLFPPFFLHQL